MSPYITFTASGNEGPQPLPSNQRVNFGKECELYYSNGGCGGIDSGRCGVTENGE
eukprot:SAG31_NODE_10716_length_1107_cov_0.912698_2_plen_54_part_01